MVNRKNGNRVEIVGRVYIAILLIIFGGMVLHTPLSVGLGTIWPDYSILIKSWKEILMLIAGLISLFLLYKNKQMKILKDPIILVIGIYAVLHLVLLFYQYQGLTSSLAGLAIDLRYLLFFSLVYIAMKLYPHYRKLFIKVGIAGALIVLVFAVLQAFVLPHDVLKYIGYNVDTISPYLTVDQNYDFIRINSTMRGPNPLGAYAGIVIALVISVIAKGRIIKDKWQKALAIMLIFGGAVALWFSYSRSAMLAVVIAICIVLAVAVMHKLSTKMWITISVLTLVAFSVFLALGNNSFISNVILHENPSNIDNISSNAGHVDSLKSGLVQFMRQPLGAGIGSTGSASILSNKPEVIENQYLYIAHEVGWLGLGIFLIIFISVLAKLWQLRNDWLALGIFASGIGMAIICLFLPAWVDDPTAIIWWGLAAIVVGSRWYIVDGRVKTK